MFRSRTSRDSIEFVSKLLIYEPKKRLEPFLALTDPYFDELRDQNTRLPNGSSLPDLFDFTKGIYNSNKAIKKFNMLFKII